MPLYTVIGFISGIMIGMSIGTYLLMDVIPFIYFSIGCSGIGIVLGRADVTNN